MNNEDVKVSVICLAYNHEKYIRNTLENFVSQKVNFAYEVIVHDDASTDSTATIIKEFEKKYPDIIKPIYQSKNQYSNGVKITNKIVFPATKGKYIAFCEGDDYWCDDSKLQKQVEFLESNPHYSACTHNSKIINCSDNSEIKIYPENDIDVDPELTIKEGSMCFHTSSLLCRREFLLYPEEFSIPGVGDYPRAIYLALKGKIKYFSKVMSVYRFGTENSWTNRSDFINHPERMTLHYNRVEQMLIEVDKYTNYKYHKTVADTINRNKVNCLYSEKKYREIIKSKNLFKWYKNHNNAKGVLHLYLLAYCPRMAKLLCKEKR